MHVEHRTHSIMLTMIMVMMLLMLMRRESLNIQVGDLRGQPDGMAASSAVLVLDGWRGGVGEKSHSLVCVHFQ